MHALVDRLRWVLGVGNSNTGHACRVHLSVGSRAQSLWGPLWESCGNCSYSVACLQTRINGRQGIEEGDVGKPVLGWTHAVNSIHMRCIYTGYMCHGTEGSIQEGLSVKG